MGTVSKWGSTEKKRNEKRRKSPKSVMRAEARGRFVRAGNYRDEQPEIRAW